MMSVIGYCSGNAYGDETTTNERNHPWMRLKSMDNVTHHLLILEFGPSGIEMMCVD